MIFTPRYSILLFGLFLGIGGTGRLVFGAPLKLTCTQALNNSLEPKFTEIIAELAQLMDSTEDDHSLQNLLLEQHTALTHRFGKELSHRILVEAQRVALEKMEDRLNKDADIKPSKPTDPQLKVLRPERLTSFHSTPELVWAAFSPDAQHIGTISRELGDDSDFQPLNLKIWDAKTGTMIREIPASNMSPHLKTLAFFEDGQRLLAPYGGETPFKVWNTTTGLPVFESEIGMKLRDSDVSVVGINKDQSKLFLLTHSSVTIWDGQSGKLLYSLKGKPAKEEEGFVYAAFSEDGQKITALTKNGQIQTYKSESGQIISTLKTEDLLGKATIPHNVLLTQPISGDQQLLVVLNNGFALWDLAQKKILHRTEFAGPIASNQLAATLSPDGRILAVRTSYTRLELWQIHNPERGPVIIEGSYGFARAESAVSFSPDSEYFALLNLDSHKPESPYQVQVWKLYHYLESDNGVHDKRADPN